MAEYKDIALKVATGDRLDALAEFIGAPGRKLVPGESDLGVLNDPHVPGMRLETDEELRARLLAQHRENMSRGDHG